MMHKQLETLIRVLYSSLVEPNGFSHFLTSLIHECQLRSGAIVMVNKSEAKANIVWMHGLEIQNAAMFIANHQQQDPLIHLLNLSQPGQLLTMGDNEAAETQRKHPEFFQNLNEDLDIYYAAGVVLAVDQDWVSQLFFHRSKRQGEFTLHECALFNALIPHIQHAMQLYHLKLKQDQRAQLVESLFNQIKLPIVLLTSEAKVIHCNAIAIEYLRHQQYLQIINQTLICLQCRDQQTIYQAIANCLHKGESQYLQLSKDASNPVAFTFVPLVSYHPPCETGVAMFIYPQQELQLNLDTLKQLFDLNDKEAKICAKLVNGYAPSDIAPQLYLSYETVRTYLKRIMKKTNTTRQNELVAKILASPANHPISAPHKQQAS